MLNLKRSHRRLHKKRGRRSNYGKVSRRNL